MTLIYITYTSYDITYLYFFVITGVYSKTRSVCQQFYIFVCMQLAVMSMLISCWSHADLLCMFASQ